MTPTQKKYLMSLIMAGGIMIFTYPLISIPNEMVKKNPGPQLFYYMNAAWILLIILAAMVKFRKRKY
jgi:hypothetical protein